MPSGTQVHVGVYDINERQHSEINRRRTDLNTPDRLPVRAAVIFQCEPRILFCDRTARDPDDFKWFAGTSRELRGAMARCFPAPTGMPSVFARRKRKVQVAGSDAHALGVRGYHVY